MINKAASLYIRIFLFVLVFKSVPLPLPNWEITGAFGLERENVCAHLTLAPE